ncbi:MAG: hypothetical protein QNJ61_18245 [Desulfobacterales bacterium]|nr:hypothetical protein [Desulfobacterales bacterium]
MKSIHRRAARPACLVLTVILLGACSAPGPVVRQQGNLGEIQKVAILPYINMADLHGTDTGVRSPITGRVFVTGPVTDQADRFMTDQLISRVQQDTELTTVPSRDAASILETLARIEGPQASRRQQIARTGKRLGADGIILGHVYRFRERSGGGMASESPSSVAFDLYLIDCRQERVLWSAFYDYTQQALSENLGGIGNFFRRGGRWVTAEELAAKALEDIFEDFPGK